ncbi:MAG: hypothetical protein IJ149_04885 [Oscillospiraceae bacterium]|nr:hypothetical protein [Oscillospiraceae bacterium]
MILDINMKLDVSPEWFEEQTRRDGWHEYLCQLLSVYKVKDEAGAKQAAERMIAAGISPELIKSAME